MKRKNILWMTCREATFLHTQKQEGKLKVTERLGLYMHLFFCKLCALFFKQMEELEKAAHRSTQARNATLSLEAKEKMRQALLKQGNN